MTIVRTQRDGLKWRDSVYLKVEPEELSEDTEEMKLLSRVWFFVILWTVAYQDPSYVEFSKQEYWSGLPFPSPGDLPNPGIEPRSPSLQADTLPSEPPGKPKGQHRCWILKRKRLQGWLTPEVLIFPSLLTQLPLTHLFFFFLSFLNFVAVWSFLVFSIRCLWL